MQIFPRFPRQFSLRGMFVVMTLFAMFFGVHVRRVLEYKSAVVQLYKRGISLGCTHGDGLGPDFLYSWELFRIPMSFVNAWYDEYLRIEVHDMALVRDTTFTSTDARLLAKIPFAYGISVHDSRFDEDALETMIRTCQFDQIAFVDTPLTCDEFEQIASMTSLTKLWLLGTSQSNEGIELLHQRLPNCEILTE